jgi:hypothetical protein
MFRNLPRSTIDLLVDGSQRPRLDHSGRFIRSGEQASRPRYLIVNIPPPTCRSHMTNSNTSTLCRGSMFRVRVTFETGSCEFDPFSSKLLNSTPLRCCRGAISLAFNHQPCHPIWTILPMFPRTPVWGPKQGRRQHRHLASRPLLRPPLMAALTPLPTSRILLPSTSIP